MTHKEICQIIKQKTDAFLPDYKGKIGIGGNIFHKKKTDFGFLMVWQDLLSYHNFPISCGLCIFNDLIGYNLALVMNLSKKEAEEQFWIKLENLKFSDDNFRFEISNQADIETWFEFFKTEFSAKADEVFNRFSSLDDLETKLNKQFLNQSTKDFEFSGNKNYELGLITARLLNKPYYQEIYEKHQKIHTERDADFSLFQKIYEYLQNATDDELNNKESLLKKLK